MHPLIPELSAQLRSKRLSRRDFLRFSTLLGLSLTGARYLAACAQPPEAPPPAQIAPVADARAAFQRGGSLKVAARILRVDHPARFSSLAQAHPWRHVFETLARIGPQGLAQPHLLEKWEANPDLSTWTLTLKTGIQFNNGQELSAEDVSFSFSQWLDPEVGSPLRDTLSYLEADGVEQLDRYTLALHLKAPTIYLPEHLCQATAAILPKSAEIDISHQAVGTGPFRMLEYIPGERCRLAARSDYWRVGADGRLLPYLDEIVMLQFGQDHSADLAALQTSQVDTVLEPTVSLWQAVRDDPRFTILSTPTSETRLLRMRVDQPPWQDNRVRLALKHCHDRGKILEAVLMNQGAIGEDSHVAPSHPEYSALIPLPFDPAKARGLLAEAGHPDGLSVELVLPAEQPETARYAEVLKEDAAAGGFAIQIKTIPEAQYWERWTEWNLGITPWAHYALAPMLLSLAYAADTQGNPVPWNETRWVDQEFNDLLRQAEGTLDLARRRELVARLAAIQQERGSICTPFFMNSWQIFHASVHGISPSSEGAATFEETWKET